MTNNEPKWLSEKAIRIIQETLIARTGGMSGILNAGMIYSTLNKAKNTYYYENKPSIFKLAATYGYGFIKNHCFVDGNKRVALASVDVFLRINGYALNASEVEAASFFLDLAGTLDAQEEAVERLTKWIENNVSLIEK